MVPEQFRQEFIDELHGGKLGGHLGLKKTLACVRRRYFWSGMVADVRACLRRCSKCARRKPPPRKRIAPLQQYNIRGTMDRVAMDLVNPLPRTEDGNQWILVVGDYSTRWMEAYALGARAETVATKLTSLYVDSECRERSIQIKGPTSNLRFSKRCVEFWVSVRLGQRRTILSQTAS